MYQACLCEEKGLDRYVQGERQNYVSESLCKRKVRTLTCQKEVRANKECLA